MPNVLFHRALSKERRPHPRPNVTGGAFREAKHRGGLRCQQHICQNGNPACERGQSEHERAFGGLRGLSQDSGASAVGTGLGGVPLHEGFGAEAQRCRFLHEVSGNAPARDYRQHVHNSPQPVGLPVVQAVETVGAGFHSKRRLQRTDVPCQEEQSGWARVGSGSCTRQACRAGLTPEVSVWGIVREPDLKVLKDFKVWLHPPLPGLRA